MNFLSLQHIAIEDPGYIKDLLLADGHNLTTIQLDEGDKIPTNLDSFDVMFSMGGPMDTWMEKEHPWLIDEKKAINEFVIEKKKPFDATHWNGPSKSIELFTSMAKKRK